MTTVTSPAAPLAVPGRTKCAVLRLGGMMLVLGLLGLWEISARLGWVESTNWPPVSAVVVALVEGLVSGELARLLASTLWRMSSGYVVGCTMGIALGCAMSVNRWVRYVIKPLIEVIRPIPAPAIVPALILLLGVDDTLKIFVVALACFLPVFLNTLAAMTGIDEVLMQTAQTFRIGRLRILLRVSLPASLPMIAAGMRMAIGTALVVTVIAEMISGSGGIGYYIVQMQYAMKPEAMYSAVVCLSATGYILNRCFVMLEYRIIPWMGK